MATYVQLKSGVIVPESEYAERQARPVLDEIASLADGRDITRGYVDGLPVLPPEDAVLRARGGGYEIYEEVLRDDQVKAALQQRRLALVAKEWTVEPASGKRRDRAAADFVREQLDRIDWDAVTHKMLSGVFYGYAVAECLYAIDGRFVVLKGIKVRRQRRFAFTPKGELRLLTSRNPQGEPLPPKKFWAFSCGADDDDDPYGLGLAHWLYWPVLFKKNGVKFWLVFLEKFGQPTAVGKYPPHADQADKDRLLGALRAIRTEAAIRIPETMQVELLEAARSGTADYVTLHDRMNQAISKVILGHTGATDATPGRLGGEDLAGEVRADLVKADADLICNSFNQTVVRWLTAWNFPGANPPKVWREVEEPEDLKARADREKILFDMGFRPTLKHVQSVYGGEFEERKKPPSEPGRNADAGGRFAEPGCCGDGTFAEGGAFPDQTALEQAMAALDDQALQTQAEALLKPVLELAESAPDALLGRLAETYPDMDDRQLQETLARMIFVAEVWGRLNA